MPRSDNAPNSLMDHLPIVDLRDVADAVAERIGVGCRAHGFFYVVGHDVDEGLCLRLEERSHRFFALADAVKSRWAMARGGRAWRGWFPLGGELTSGRPDWKEGLYLGTELPADHPRVRAGWALHGPNLWPAEVPELRDAALGYMAATTRAAHALLEG